MNKIEKLAVVVLPLIMMCIGTAFGYKLRESREIQNKIDGHPIFVWNDDVESIPSVKDTTKYSLIEIEGVDGDTIYIGNKY